MLNESEYKKIIKEVGLLNPKDRKLIDVTKNLVGCYFVRPRFKTLYKVYGISPNPRGFISVLYEYTDFGRIKEHNDITMATGWHTVNHFVRRFNLFDEKAIDDLCTYLKN